MMRRVLWLLSLPLWGAEMPDLPGTKWLRFGLEHRMRWEGFSAPRFAEEGDYHLLNRYRFTTTILPASFLRFNFQVQDARLYWKNAQTNGDAYKDGVDLRIASLTLGRAEKGAVWATVGRQELNFGDQRLVGAANWGAAGRTFDAVKVDFRLAGVHVETFAASVVRIHPSSQNHHVDGDNLHGMYAHLDKIAPGAKIEPYVFWRVNGKTHLNQRTYGVRWVGTLPQKWSYNTEFVGQDQSGGAVHLQAGRKIGKNYWSGEVNLASPRFELIYPTPHYKYGLADQVGWKNVRHVRGGIDWGITPRFSVATYHNAWWLQNPQVGMFNAQGNRIVAGGQWTESFVGHEFDVDAAFDINKKTQLRAGVGHLFPGAFLKQATPGKGFTFPYVSLQYGF